MTSYTGVKQESQLSLTDLAPGVVRNCKQSDPKSTTLFGSLATHCYILHDVGLTKILNSSNGLHSSSFKIGNHLVRQSTNEFLLTVYSIALSRADSEHFAVANDVE